MRLKTGLAAAVAATALAAGAFQAAAQEVKLRVGDSFPVGHYIPEKITKNWMNLVTEATAGKVSFEYFPAEQMGKAKDLLALTQDGVLDIGYVGASYVSDKLPLSSVGELPEAFKTSCQGTLAFWDIARPGGALDKAEFAPAGVRVLMALVLPPYQVFSSTREITGLDSLKGLKLRTTGGGKDLATVRVGAIPVQIPAPESREALSRGTIDGLLFPHSSITPYGVTPHLKYATQDLNFGSFVVTYVISQQGWDALSPEVQAAMSEAGDKATRQGCEIVEKLDIQDKQKIASEGVTFVSLPEADVAKIGELMSTVSGEWAADLDKRGKAGTEILEAFRAALAKLPQ